MSIWRQHGCHCRCDRPRIAARPASPRHDAALALGIHRDPKPSDPTDDPGLQNPEYVGGLEDSLGGRGLVVGEPPSSWPGRRLLPPIDQRLHDARRAIVIISKAFLASSWSRKELDGLTTRSGVVASSRTSSRRTWQDIPPGSQSPRPPAPRPSGWFACSVPGRRPGRSNSRSRDGDLVRTPTSLTPGTDRPCAGATRCVGGDGRPCREHAGQRPRERFGEVYRASRVSRTLK